MTTNEIKERLKKIVKRAHPEGINYLLLDLKNLIQDIDSQTNKNE